MSKTDKNKTKEYAKKLANYYLLVALFLFIGGIIVTIYWLIESILEKASYRQYIGVALSVIFSGLFALACFLRGKKILSDIEDRDN